MPSLARHPNPNPSLSLQLHKGECMKAGFAICRKRSYLGEIAFYINRIFRKVKLFRKLHRICIIVGPRKEICSKSVLEKEAKSHLLCQRKPQNPKFSLKMNMGCDGTVHLTPRDMVTAMQSKPSLNAALLHLATPS